MRKLRKMLSLLITLAMILSLLITAAYASGKTQVTTKLDFVNTITTSVDNIASEGWAWDAATKTLTLDGLNMSLTNVHPGIEMPADSTIVLIGDNTINDVSNLGNTNAIRYKTGKLIIEGNGTLYAKVTDSNWCCRAITSWEDSLIIRGNAKVKAEGIGNNAGGGFGIGVDIQGAVSGSDSVIIEDNAELIAIGSSSAIYDYSIQNPVTYPATHSVRSWNGSDYANAVTHVSGNPLSASLTNVKIADFTNIPLPVQYNIKYNLNGGYLPPSTQVTYREAVGLTLPIPTKAKNMFMGWYNDAGFTGNPITAITSSDSGDKTFWAMWQPLPFESVYDPTKTIIEGAIVSEGTFSADIITSKLYDVTADTDYSYSQWLRGEGDLIIRVMDNNDTVIATQTITANDLDWQKVTVNFNSGASTQVKLEISTDSTHAEPIYLYGGAYMIAGGNAETRILPESSVWSGLGSNFKAITKAELLAKYPIEGVYIRPEVSVPIIIHVPFQMLPGEVGSVFGGYFGEDKSKSKVAIQPLTGFTGTLSPDTATYQIDPFAISDQVVQFEIPANIKADVWAIWVKNDEGWSDVQYVNKAQIFWVNEHNIYPGQKLYIGGRAIPNPSNRSANGIAVMFVPTDGGTPLQAKVIDVSNYIVSFIVPDNIVAGMSYDLRYTNGAGDTYGWAEMQEKDRECVTAFGGTTQEIANRKYFDDNWDINGEWTKNINVSNTVTAAVLTTNTAAQNSIEINNAKNTLGGSGIVRIPAGTYEINAISLGNNVALVGAGMDQTILKYMDPDRTNKRTIVSAGYNTAVLGLSIVSDIIRMPTANHWFGLIEGLNMSGGTKSDGHAVADVRIDVKDGSGVRFSGGNSRKSVENSHIKCSDAAIFMAYAGGPIRVRNNILENGIGDDMGAWADEAHDITYDRTWIDGNTWIGNSFSQQLQDLPGGTVPAGQEDRYYFSDWSNIRTNDGTGWQYHDQEHRIIDIGGDEVLFINNTTLGRFGNKITNDGEGVCNQGWSPNSFSDWVTEVTPDTLKTGRDLSNIVKGYWYVLITGGPGLGQARKIVDWHGDVIVIDKPWDILPEPGKSTYCVDIELAARNVMGDNYYAAENNKATFGYWTRAYDLTVSGNTMLGGAGVWYNNGYFINVYNNYIETAGAGYFPVDTTAIGPSGDGGFYTGGVTDYSGCYIFNSANVTNTDLTSQQLSNLFPPNGYGLGDDDPRNVINKGGTRLNFSSAGFNGSDWGRAYTAYNNVVVKSNTTYTIGAWVRGGDVSINMCGAGWSYFGTPMRAEGQKDEWVWIEADWYSMMFTTAIVSFTMPYEGYVPNSGIKGINIADVYVYGITLTEKGGDGTNYWTPGTSLIKRPSDAFTTVYGLRAVHNTMIGVSKTKVNSHYGNAQFADKSGIFIASPNNVAYPNALGDIIDGNLLRNTVNGVQLSNCAWQTVLRNNDFTDTGNPYIGKNYAVNLTELSGGLRAPGALTASDDLAAIRKYADAYEIFLNGDPYPDDALYATKEGFPGTLPKLTDPRLIDKSALSGFPPDTTALKAAITTATANKANVVVSVNGFDVAPTQDWVTQAAMTAYQNAIAAANVTLNDASATQAAVDQTVSDLATATVAFDSAKAKGIVDKTALSTAINNATANKANVVVSVNGFDVAPTQDWVTQAVMTAYQNAIDAATAVLNDANATQTVVNTAISDLAAATTAFNNAKAKGTKGTIIVVNVVTGNGGSDVNFAINSANGKGYEVYLSTTGADGSFTLYTDVNYNSKGIHVKGLKNGVTYYMYFEYNDGKGNISRSSIITLKPSK